MLEIKDGLNGNLSSPARRVRSQKELRREQKGGGLTASTRILTIGFLLVGVSAAAWMQKETLLRGLADLWIVSEPFTRADAVVVLGGGLKYRPPIAADLYKEGIVSKVLVSQLRESNRAALLKLGVPKAAIEMFGTENRNTADEARTLRDWADHNNVSVLIVPSEIFAARRVRWIFHREFQGTGVRIEVPSFEEDIKRAEWWTTSWGLITFWNEILKYIYYRLKY